MLKRLELFFEKYPWALYFLVCLFLFFIVVFFISYILIRFVLSLFIDKNHAEVIALISASFIVLFIVYRVAITGGVNIFPYGDSHSSTEESSCIGRTGNYSENC